MPITYTTRITGLRVRNEGDLTKVVRVVDFIVTGTDGSVRYDIASSHEFRGDLDAGGFTPFETLTEGDVVGWLESEPSILGGIKSNIRYYVEQKQLEAALAPMPVPWDEPVDPQVVP